MTSQEITLEQAEREVQAMAKRLSKPLPSAAARIERLQKIIDFLSSIEWMKSWQDDAPSKNAKPVLTRETIREMRALLEWIEAK